MSVRADKIFPVLIPRLISTPITAFNARALASLVRVAGAALGRRLTNIVDALQTAVETEKGEDTAKQIDEALTAVLGSVEDHESGLGSIQMHLLGLAKHETPAKRVVGCSLFARFCQATEADFSDYTVDWIRQLVSMFDDRVPEVVGEAWKALDALVKTIEKEDMEPLVVSLRRTIEGTGTAGLPTDGFSRPNGLKPILRASGTFFRDSPCSNHFVMLSQPSCSKDFSLERQSSASRPPSPSATSSSGPRPRRSSRTASRRSDLSVRFYRPFQFF